MSDKVLGAKRPLSGANEEAVTVWSVAECKAALVPHNRDDKETVTVVLEKAPLELIQMKDKRIELVNCDDHKNLLVKAGKDFSRFRPDIVHQCLLTLLDSPLNKAGKLVVYIHTEQNVLIEVSPMLRVPRTFKRFAGLMVELLQKHKIRAAGSQDLLMKVIANPIQKYLPAGALKVGLSVGGRLVSAPALVKENAEKKQVVFVVGAVSHDDPVKEPKYGADYVEELVSVSNFSLSAACCCGKLCEAYENLWGIL